MTPHLTPELVKGYRRGRISYDELLDLVFGHVGAVCSHCRGGYEALESPDSFSDPALLCKTVSRLALEHHSEVQRSIEGAQADIRSLKGLPPDLRRQRIERAYRRFRGEDLVELLVAEAIWSKLEDSRRRPSKGRRASLSTGSTFSVRACCAFCGWMAGSWPVEGRLPARSPHSRKLEKGFSKADSNSERFLWLPTLRLFMPAKGTLGSFGSWPASSPKASGSIPCETAPCFDRR